MEHVLAIVIVFSGIVFIHELGHFSVARFFKIGVQSFSIGFGPKLITKTIGKTEYCLSAIPLGGYVSLVGEEENGTLPEGFTREESFTLRPAWQRLCVILAGAIFNILLGIIIYWAIFYFSGKSYLLPIVGDVTPNSPAMQAGLTPGDTILRINNLPITRFEQIRELTQINAGEKMSLVVANTQGEERTIEITPTRSIIQDILGDTSELWILGITPSNTQGHLPLGVFSSLQEGISQTYNDLKLTLFALVKLIQGKLSKDNISGPIMIAKIIYNNSHQGIIVIANIAALISINLGFMNLLPIPVLDGGHAIFLLVEMIRNKPINPIWKERFTKVGFALLITLMIFATYNDVLRLFNK